MSTEFALIWLPLLALGGLGTGIGAVLFARQAAKYSRSVADWAVSGWETSLSDSKTAKLESRIAEVEDTLASHEASLKRLRSKYAMRDLRERKKEPQGDNGADDGADLLLDDDAKAAEKRRLRLYAKSKGLMR